ncbi:hypothetical protein CQW23_24580 [Capsicum baccatum]|uniref:Retrovirus-related Pol polyprotein from transposon TNT 1-94-like beta-barrel domain-containing protein n=1 Tax=Capsicum baccatum TaxID=33114 RepID=A0A2G2VV58_CAPBA|nr:hypothetical protein CQW23_24580 [Capsicum baccatum]
MLFMAYCDTNEVASDMLFVDGGFSNHMSDMKSTFKELDKTQKSTVRLGDNSSLQAEDEGQEAIPNSFEEAIAPETSATLEEPLAEPIPLERSTRARKVNFKYSNQSCQFAFIVSDPLFYEEAIEKEKRKNAIKKELMARQRNKIWHITDLPNEKIVVVLK